MRRLLVGIVWAVLLFPAPARSELPPANQFHLYAEMSREHPCWCPVASGSIARFDLWIWCLPAEGGVCGAEFLMCYPLNTVQTSTILNMSLIVNHTGSLDSGFSAECSSCQTDWFWIARQEIWVVSPEKGTICVDPHPSSGIVGVRSCEAGHPLEEAYLYGYGLQINEPGGQTDFCETCAPANEVVISVESESWGRIKSLFSN